MKRIGLLMLAGTLMACTAFAQDAKTRDQSGKKGAQISGSASASSDTSASAQAGQNSASLSSGTIIQSELSGSLDAKKNKEGDRVVARTTQDVKQDGQVVIPKNSKLVGHVTETKARAQGESESALGIMFDKAVLKNGREMPLQVAIQAVAAAQSTTSSSLGDVDAMGSGSAGGMASGGARSGGGLVSAVGSTVGGAAGTVSNTAGAAGSAAGGAVNSTVNTATSATGNVGGTHAVGALTSSSTGVIGLQGLSLNSVAANSTQGSLIVSSTKNVHLDSGTRLLLRAEGSKQ